ncbi:MAG: AraC family transcriptional regulator [Verrucomicrobiaceae bacterium]|nr:AraC family transcriptional regulator [Verrucomicrobiaceae bacterium]
MPDITLLVLPEALPSSLSLPMEMLTAADQLARIDRHTDKKYSSLTHRFVGPGGAEIKTANGLTLKLSGDIDAVQNTDLLIIPALWRNPRTALRNHRNILPWLQRLALEKTLLCAVGTGSFLLAEAGLLDDKPATTHWFYFDSFAQRYPRVLLQRHHLITEAGNIYCAGSVNSVADLTIHFIELLYGRELARKVEAQFSPEIRQPFASHAYSAGRADVHSDEVIVQVQDYLRTNCAETLHMPELAKQLGLSLRSLNRRFKSATGMSPNSYLLQQRLHNARDLLRTTNLSIAEVAMTAGYSDSDYFSRLFREAMKQTPRDYRESVRGKLFTVI